MPSEDLKCYSDEFKTRTQQFIAAANIFVTSRAALVPFNDDFEKMKETELAVYCLVLCGQYLTLSKFHGSSELL